MDYESSAVRSVGSVEEGWELIKSDYWLFFAMMLVEALIIIAISFALSLVVGLISSVISAGVVAATQNANETGKISAVIAPQLISQALSFFTGLITATLAGMMSCGIYTAMSRKANGGVPEFGDLFAGFQYFQQCLVVSLIVTLIHFVLNVAMLIIGVIFGVSAFGAGMLTRNGKFDPSALAPIIGVVIVIALIYIVISLVVSACTIFAYPLITERKLSAIEALRLSVKAGLANFFGIFGLFIIQSLVALGGALLCLVGIFFVIPIIQASVFAAYLSVFGRTPHVGQQMPPTPDSFGGDYGRPNYGGQNYGGQNYGGM